MASRDPRVAMVAGETSGDLLSGLLLGGLKARWPGLSSCGIGGPRMAEHGFEAWWPYQKLAVHGFNMEVLRRFREIWTIRRDLGDRLLADRPDVFVGVDAPDFNLGLEARLKAEGIKTGAFRQPLHLGLAWRAHPQDPSLGGPHAAACSPLSPRCTTITASRRRSSGTRWRTPFRWKCPCGPGPRQPGPG